MNKNTSGIGILFLMFIVLTFGDLIVIKIIKIIKEKINKK